MHYEIHASVNGEFYFTQVADNGQTLTTSETYTRKRDAQRAAMTAAGNDPIRFIDRTYDDGEE